MSVPTHGVDCKTWAFPTKCKKCGDAVYYFSCSCGSKVFFDDLGEPWQEHCCEFNKSDRAWAQSRPKKKFGKDGVLVQLSESVTATRLPETPTKDWNIHPGVVDEARRNDHSRQRNPIESVPPGDDWTVEITGVVRETEAEVNVYGSLKLPHTAMSGGFLGTLGHGEWGKVTIHVLKDVIYSYTAWAPRLCFCG